MPRYTVNIEDIIPLLKDNQPLRNEDGSCKRYNFAVVFHKDPIKSASIADLRNKNGKGLIADLCYSWHYGNKEARDRIDTLFNSDDSAHLFTPEEKERFFYVRTVGLALDKILEDAKQKGDVLYIPPISGPLYPPKHADALKAVQGEVLENIGKFTSKLSAAQKINTDIVLAILNDHKSLYAALYKDILPGLTMLFPAHSSLSVMEIEERLKEFFSLQLGEKVVPQIVEHIKLGKVSLPSPVPTDEALTNLVRQKLAENRVIIDTDLDAFVERIVEVVSPEIGALTNKQVIFSHKTQAFDEYVIDAIKNPHSMEIQKLSGVTSSISLLNGTIENLYKIYSKYSYKDIALPALDAVFSAFYERQTRQNQDLLRYVLAEMLFLHGAGEHKHFFSINQRVELINRFALKLKELYSPEALHSFLPPTLEKLQHLSATPTMNALAEEMQQRITSCMKIKSQLENAAETAIRSFLGKKFKYLAIQDMVNAATSRAFIGSYQDLLSDPKTLDHVKETIESKVTACLRKAKPHRGIVARVKKTVGHKKKRITVKQEELDTLTTELIEAEKRLVEEKGTSFFNPVSPLVTLDNPAIQADALKKIQDFSEKTLGYKSLITLTDITAKEGTTQEEIVASVVKQIKALKEAPLPVDQRHFNALIEEIIPVWKASWVSPAWREIEQELAMILLPTYAHTYGYVSTHQRGDSSAWLATLPGLKPLIPFYVKQAMTIYANPEGLLENIFSQHTRHLFEKTLYVLEQQFLLPEAQNPLTASEKQLPIIVGKEVHHAIKPVLHKLLERSLNNKSAPTERSLKKTVIEKEDDHYKLVLKFTHHDKRTSFINMISNAGLKTLGITSSRPAEGADELVLRLAPETTLFTFLTLYRKNVCQDEDIRPLLRTTNIVRTASDEHGGGNNLRSVSTTVRPRAFSITGPTPIIVPSNSHGSVASVDQENAETPVAAEIIEAIRETIQSIYKVCPQQNAEHFIENIHMLTSSPTAINRITAAWLTYPDHKEWEQILPIAAPIIFSSYLEDKSYLSNQEEWSSAHVQRAFPYITSQIEKVRKDLFALIAASKPNTHWPMEWNYTAKDASFSSHITAILYGEDKTLYHLHDRLPDKEELAVPVIYAYLAAPKAPCWEARKLDLEQVFIPAYIAYYKRISEAILTAEPMDADALEELRQAFDKTLHQLRALHPTLQANPKEEDQSIWLDLHEWEKEHFAEKIKCLETRKAKVNEDAASFKNVVLEASLNLLEGRKTDKALKTLLLFWKKHPEHPVWDEALTIPKGPYHKAGTVLYLFLTAFKKHWYDQSLKASPDYAFEEENTPVTAGNPFPLTVGNVLREAESLKAYFNDNPKVELIFRETPVISADTTAVITPFSPASAERRIAPQVTEASAQVAKLLAPSLAISNKPHLHLIGRSHSFSERIKEQAPLVTRKAAEESDKKAFDSPETKAFLAKLLGDMDIVSIFKKEGIADNRMQALLLDQLCHYMQQPDTLPSYLQPLFAKFLNALDALKFTADGAKQEPPFYKGIGIRAIGKVGSTAVFVGEILGSHEEGSSKTPVPAKNKLQEGDIIYSVKTIDGRYLWDQNTYETVQEKIDTLTACVMNNREHHTLIFRVYRQEEPGDGFKDIKINLGLVNYQQQCLHHFMQAFEKAEKQQRPQAHVAV